MAFIQYFSQAESESLVNSFAHKLENYGMIIPKRFEHSKQLYAEFHNSNNEQYSKVNLLISWVNQNQKKCSIVTKLVISQSDLVIMRSSS